MPLHRARTALVAAIPSVIREIRGQRVVVDEDLARLYGVATKRLNEQVRRNRARFPADFMFRLSAAEARVLWSQIATTNGGRGGRRQLPYVFTEHGAVMLASVLRSARAVEMSLHVVRAFVHMRAMLAGQRLLARKLGELEQRVGGHDRDIAALVQTIRQLMMPPAPTRRRIGF